TWPATGDVIVLKRADTKTKLSFQLPGSPRLDEKSNESFRIINTSYQNQRIIIVEGAGERGVLFGTGQLLRSMKYRPENTGFIQLPSMASSPDKGIRGHQLGYRNTANSY